MKKKLTLTTLATLAGFATASFAQTPEVTLTFDDSLADFGAIETTATDVDLSLSRLGGAIATNDFTELDGLSSETYTVSGTELGSANPFDFTVSSSDSMVLDGTGLDVSGGGIDSGESITFTFSRNITILEFNLQDVGASEFAAITVAGSTTDYADSTGDSHTVDLDLTAGQSLVFEFAASNGADYGLQAFSFSVVPEPNAYALLAGLLGLSFVALRRRRA